MIRPVTPRGSLCVVTGTLMLLSSIRLLRAVIVHMRASRHIAVTLALAGLFIGLPSIVQTQAEAES